jgi:eukaryotic-like serine/threonine-protein kinase
MSVTTHPTPETLAAFARGDLPPAELSVVAEHVGICAACCTALQSIPDDTFGNLARAAGAPAVTTPDPVGDLAPTRATPDNIPADLAAHPRYRILKELGAGGMGVVYKAEDRVMERLVALKVMAPHLTSKAGAVERFNKEVIAAARLEHQNIVRAYDKGEAGNLHFLVMEYLEGESLDRYVARKGPLAIHLACTFTRQAANGLQHAAEKGLTHRDIKPQNLMVLRKGQIKVMDFGLARFVRNDNEEVPAVGRLPFGAGKPVSDPLTNPNLIMGTPDYLSPEQARNSHAVDHRSDIYSLGCTLYFLLTGKAPFAHESSLIDKLLGHTEGKVPSLRKARPDVPEGLVAVIKKMMAKKPDDRYQSATDVAAALAPFTRPDAAPEVVDAVVIAPAAAVSTVPPVLTLPNSEPTPPRTRSRAELAREADTAPNPDQPTLVESERPRKTKKAKKTQLVPWWKQKWAKIGAAAVAGLVIVAIVIAAGGKKEQPPPPGGGGDNTADKNKDGNPGTSGPSPKDKQSTGTNPFRPGQTGGIDKTLPLLYVVPSKGLWREDYDDVVDVLKQGGVTVVTVSGDGGKSTLQGNPREGITVDKRLDEVNAAGFSAVVFCGFRIDEYIGDGKHSATVAKLIKDLREQGKPVTAICVGVGVLASHDVLEEKLASRSPALIEYYPTIADRVNWVNARVHPARDTRNPGSSPIITAGMARDARDFAVTLLKLYKKD